MPNAKSRGSARLLMAVAAAALVFVVLPAASSPAAAQTSSTIQVTGHGWGHGRGMGQYGAYGYSANSGWNSTQILSHFYSNTHLAGLDPNSLISVWLKGYDGADLSVTSSTTFTVGQWTVGGGSGARITKSPNGQWLLYTHYNRCAGDQRGEFGPYALDAGYLVQSTVAAPGNDLTKMLAVCNIGGERNYRGQLKLLDFGGLHVVNIVPIDQYARGVVPRESPSSWPVPALEAQAVAARSYALAEGGEGGNRYAWAKTCDDVFCQVYGGAGLNGARLEANTSDFATASTGGQVLRYGNNTLARTEFSSSTGGYTNGTPQC